MWKGRIDALHHKLVFWDMRDHGQSEYRHYPAACREALTVADIARAALRV
jgi:pimeloyl-ACP methyl ester carboxylesterase